MYSMLILAPLWPTEDSERLEFTKFILKFMELLPRVLRCTTLTLWQLNRSRIHYGITEANCIVVANGYLWRRVGLLLGRVLQMG